MKKSIHLISRSLAFAIVLGLLLSPLMAGEAMAQSASCNNNNTGNICNNGAGGEPQGNFTILTSSSSPVNSYTCNNNGTIQAACGCSDGSTPATYYFYCTGMPEMSDWLALVFVIVAGGMIYRFRRRALARA